MSNRRNARRTWIAMGAFIADAAETQADPIVARWILDNIGVTPEAVEHAFAVARLWLKPMLDPAGGLVYYVFARFPNGVGLIGAASPALLEIAEQMAEEDHEYARMAALLDKIPDDLSDLDAEDG